MGALRQVVAGASRIVPNTCDLVDYHEENGEGIRLHLSRNLPLAIGEAEPAFVSQMVARARAEGYSIPNYGMCDDGDEIEMLHMGTARKVAGDGPADRTTLGVGMASLLKPLCQLPRPCQLRHRSASCQSSRPSVPRRARTRTHSLCTLRSTSTSSATRAVPRC